MISGLFLTVLSLNEHNPLIASSSSFHLIGDWQSANRLKGVIAPPAGWSVIKVKPQETETEKRS